MAAKQFFWYYAIMLIMLISKKTTGRFIYLFIYLFFGVKRSVFESYTIRKNNGQKKEKRK